MHLRFADLYDEDGADRAPPDSVELVGVLCGSQSSGRFKVAQAILISTHSDDAVELATHNLVYSRAR